MIYKIIFLAITLTFTTNFTIFSQDFDCLTKLKIRQAKVPFEVNELSKSAVCKSGEKYQYNINLDKNKDYRLTFFASSVFNHKVNFKIYNKATGELVMNLPGVSIDNVKGCALASYFDIKNNKMTHPFFDFSPKNDTQLEIVIEVEAEISNYELNSKDILATNETKGCVTVFVQSKASEETGFSN